MNLALEIVYHFLAVFNSVVKETIWKHNPEAVNLIQKEEINQINFLFCFVFHFPISIVDT